MRSRCIRSRYTASTSGRTESRSWLTRTGQPSRCGGSRVGGATSVTSAPSVVNAHTSLRATRLWLMSPTMAMWRPSSPPRCSRIV